VPDSRRTRAVTDPAWRSASVTVTVNTSRTCRGPEIGLGAPIQNSIYPSHLIMFSLLKIEFPVRFEISGPKLQSLHPALGFPTPQHVCLDLSETKYGGLSSRNPATKVK
jgi:hypothetical protein